jgi:hypothetical protein
MSRSDADDKFSEKPMVVSSPSAWEDSPKYIGESTGVLTPSGAPKKTAHITPDSWLKQPYIPVPAPKVPPPSVIVGPMNQKPASPGRQLPRPIVRPSFSSKPSIKEPPADSSVPESKPAITTIVIDKTRGLAVDQKSSETSTPVVSRTEEIKDKPAEKPAEVNRKKPPREED